MINYHNIINLLDLSKDENLEMFLITSILLFVFVALVFFVLIMIGRTTKIIDENTTENFKPECEKMLMSLLFEEEDMASLKDSKGFKKTMSDSFLRGLLMDELLRLHENLEGDHASKLEQFYKESGLVKDSFKRLRSAKWFVKCKAIAELTQMKIADAYEPIFKYTRHPNSVLRREAQLSAVKLHGFNGLQFIEGYTEYITLWEQMSFISILTKTADGVPDVSNWLTHPNESVRIFSLRLIAHFNQVTSSPLIASMLGNGSEEFIITAIETLVKLQAGTESKALTELFGKRGKHIDSEILKALAVLGTEAESHFLVSHIGANDYDIRFNATKALLSIDRNSKEVQELFKKDSLSKAIVEHIEDSRIDV